MTITPGRTGDGHGHEEVLKKSEEDADDKGNKKDGEGAG